ncbi:SDR family NAD(P)-dependent oxidoreductase [Rhodovibrionaceae bacterium A322]
MIRITQSFEQRRPITDQEDKVALVTGAARGLGLAAAKRFLAEGWRVALLDNNQETLNAAMAGLDSNRALALHLDVSKAGDVQQAMDQINESFGRLDALVNNAGIAIFKPIMETTLEDWSEVMATNLTGPFICTQAATPLMLKSGGGAVVNIASISGHRASTLRTAYGTSKAGVIQLTKQQAAELGNVGIRVNAVAPGPVDTAMAKKVHSPEIRAAYHDTIPLNRYGTEEELANAIWFLCSPQASYINGQTLSVDGGFESTGIGLPDLRD